MPRDKSSVIGTPTCSHCEVLLVAGENWSIGFAKRYSYICTICLSQQRSRHRASNPESFRVINHRAKRKPKARFLQAKRAAERRGIGWDITFEDFVPLLSFPCHYCGGLRPETH